MSKSTTKTFLVFGSRGWIGGQIKTLLLADNHRVCETNARIQNREAVMATLDQHKPDFVINCAGVTGRPNVDWCEDNKQQTVRTNVIGTLSLIDCCFLKGIPITNFGTGCIFTYDKDHAMGSGVGFKEGDQPNFIGSFYSRTKGYADQLYDIYPNCLNLRIRMPISDDLSPRNFVTKILKYARIVNIPNSLSILHDLLPISIEMTTAVTFDKDGKFASRKYHGNYNFTNPGTMSHNQVVDLYIKIVDPKVSYTNFSLEDQAKILKADRSNNELDMSKLKKAFPNLPSAEEALTNCFKRLKKNLNVQPGDTKSKWIVQQKLQTSSTQC